MRLDYPGGFRKAEITRYQFLLLGGEGQDEGGQCRKRADLEVKLRPSARFAFDFIVNGNGGRPQGFRNSWRLPSSSPRSKTP
jgi:hypothetical protein